MDLENIGMSAFSVELLKSLAKDSYEKGREEGYDAGFTAALYSVMVTAEKSKSLVEAMKYVEDFVNGPLADKDAKAKCEELAKMGLGGLD
jgi:flagellar biosynthesis/type III secretory pathway protein FliH